MPARSINTFIFVVISLFVVLLYIPSVSAIPSSDYKTVIKAPAEFRLDKEKIIPIGIEITTPEGKPFNGEVDVYADYGKLQKADGTFAYNPVAVAIKDGKGRSAVSLQGHNDVPYPLNIYVSKSHEVLYGQAKVKIRYPETIELIPLSPSAIAGNSHGPVVAVKILDQFKDMLGDAQVYIKGNTPQTRHISLTAKTEPCGLAYSELPASDKAGPGIIQATTERLASPQIFLTYTEPSTKFKGTIAGPQVVTYGKDHKDVKLQIKVQTADVKPFTGPVELWASPSIYCRLPDGETSGCWPLTLQMKDGAAEVHINMGDSYEPLSLLSFSITQGPRDQTENICSTIVKVRYAARYEITGSFNLSVPADGKTQPRIGITFYDQDGQPFSYGVGNAHFYMLDGEKNFSFDTDAKGHAEFSLPASSISGWATGQVLCGGVISSCWRIYYEEQSRQR
jgi:hypothetical protein